MAYKANITTTLFGSRVGLQLMSTVQTGGIAGRTPEFLVGPEAVRKESSTADSTGTNLKPWGISLLTTSLAAGATAVFPLDPPIPGVEKTIVWGSTTVGTMSQKIFVTSSTGGGAGFQTSGGSSFTVVASSAGAVLHLVGVTTGLWAVIQGTTGAGFSYTTTT